MMQIKRDWERALIEAGIDVPLGRRQFNIVCPFHKDNTPSLSINLDSGVWICHANPEECGKGKISALISKFLGISLFQAEKLAIGDVSGNDIVFFEEEEIEKEFEGFQVCVFPFLENKVPLWIYDRGFMSSTLLKWGCAFDKLDGSLVIPIHEPEGMRVGWVKRRPQGMSPKYLFSKGLQKKHILFGMNHIEKYRNSLCVTEGALDAMWLAQNGFNSVALLGVFLSTIQERLIIENVKQEIILCLDNDEAGRAATNAIHKRLSKQTLVSTINLPNGYKDVQDVKDKKILHKIIDERSIF